MTVKGVTSAEDVSKKAERDAELNFDPSMKQKLQTFEKSLVDEKKAGN